tara:strand:+ start:1116 stop:1295 length:180 start_codon:yes stop_codon:yes gene_type:complete
MTLQIFIGFFFHNMINSGSWAVTGSNIDCFSNFFCIFNDFIDYVFNGMVTGYYLRRTLN